MLHESELSALTTVTDATFAETVLAADRPVVVDFWAEWCASCKKLSPSLVDLAGEFGDRVLMAKLNADENPHSARAYRVMSLPTLLVFRQGELVGSLVGFKPKIALREALSTYCQLS